MADKLSDQEIVSELKRYGETVKQSIDYKRRPILIKKLNHLYAKENPPQKKGRNTGRRSRTAVAPEFSDDSQDETETESNRTPVLRKLRNKTTGGESSSRTLRNRKVENGDFNPDGDSSLLGKISGRKNRYPAVHQVEIFPDEFSDKDDTADESVYEVEEHSIGVNTSMNFNDTTDELSTSSSRSSRSKNRSTVKLSPPSVRPSPNAISNKYGKANHQQKSANLPESEHLISKTILVAMAVFFGAIAVCYMYIRRDILLPHKAALEPNDLSVPKFCEGKVCYEQNEVTRALKVLQEVHKELTVLKGQFEVGEISEEQKRLDKSAVLERARTLYRSEGEPEIAKLSELCLKLIVKNGKEWDIMAFTEVGVDAADYMEVATLESVYGDLAFMTRLKLAFFKVFYGLCLFIVCVFVGVLGIFYVRWQNKRKDKQQQKVYDLVEKIIELLQENSELAEKKNDEKYPPYMAVQHIRDQLIPVAQRKSKQWLWDEAVKFIEKNESRIRVETQMIEGEEFTVWRWLQAVPNGHKVWQGQAFGETSQNSINSLPYGPTPCLKVRNMFDASAEQSTDDWHLDVEESILEKCKNNNGILHIFVDRTSKEGCVYIKCSSCEKAYEAYQELHGWWFDGRLVTVKYLRLEHYHDRFPDSRNRRYPLKPLNNEMQSLSNPYHKSALEMT